MLALFVAAIALGALHLAGMALAARALGVALLEIRFGIGPKLVQLRGAPPLTLALLPVGGSIRLSEEDLADTTHRALIGVGGCTALITIGVLFGADLGSLGRGFVQIVRGAFSPLDLGAGWVRALLDRLAAHPEGGLATMAMKIAAYNLLPLPGLNGAAILAPIAKVVPKRLRDGLAIAGLVVTLAIGVAWAVAMVAALSAPRG